MSLQTMLSFFSASEKSFKKNNHSQCFHLEDDFYAILKRERERSDRCGQVFALVIFKTQDMEIKEAAVKLLLRSIIRRLRTIDEAGLDR